MREPVSQNVCNVTQSNDELVSMLIFNFTNEISGVVTWTFY